MYDNYNYPPGADGPNAPWNRYEKEITMKPCPDCDGNGYFEDSECCGAHLSHGICMECKEHSEPAKCEVCDGSGQVEDDEEPIDPNYDYKQIERGLLI